MSARTTRTSRAFSSNYEVEIRVTDRLRARPALLWTLFAVLGLLLILHSGQSVPVILLLSLSWAALSAREALWLAPSRVPWERLRIGADGRVRALAPARQDCLRVAAGSLLIGRFAWLDMRSAGGDGFSVLVFAGDLSPGDWRRLNLLWRHGLTG